jgi:hypothetical protein
MKKIIIIFLFLVFWIYWFTYIQAENTKKKELIKQEKIIKQKKIREEKIKILNNKLEILFKKYNKKSKIEQKEFYSRLIKLLNFYKIKYKNSDKIFLINIIFNKFVEKNNSIKLKKINFIKPKIIILKFTNNIIFNNKIIENNKENIKNNISVFIFRSSVDLKNSVIKDISKKIKNINPNILLFIDQEWGLINRYIDFENQDEINKFFIKNNNYLFLKNNLEKLSNKEIDIIRKIFPKQYWYFPSLEIIWKTYDKFKNKEKAKIFLNIIAFIRLQSLKNCWINTYGLVLDLNRWNPVISWNKRSFSKHLWKYKILVDSFINAWKNIEIILYAKHFPWHWDWSIDSHKWILNLWKKSDYLNENLDLFNYLLEKSWELQTWLMVWHIYISTRLKQKFKNIINISDFIITDDLAMMWYKKAKWKKIKNLFLSTDLIIDNKYNKLIILDTINISKIK